MQAVLISLPWGMFDGVHEKHQLHLFWWAHIEVVQVLWKNIRTYMCMHVHVGTYIVCSMRYSAMNLPPSLPSSSPHSEHSPLSSCPPAPHIAGQRCLPPPWCSHQIWWGCSQTSPHSCPTQCKSMYIRTHMYVHLCMQYTHAVEYNMPSSMQYVQSTYMYIQVHAHMYISTCMYIWRPFMYITNAYTNLSLRPSLFLPSLSTSAPPSPVRSALRTSPRGCHRSTSCPPCWSVCRGTHAEPRGRRDGRCGCALWSPQGQPAALLQGESGFKGCSSIVAIDHTIRNLDGAGFI